MPTHTPQRDLRQTIDPYVRPVETTLRDDLTIGQALQSLRQRQLEHKIFYLYVVDAHDRLVGVMPTRLLLIGDPAASIRSVMQHPVISLPAAAPIELALETFAIHRLLALPVTDPGGKLVGMVDIQLYSDELYDHMEKNRDLDVFQLIGISIEQWREGSAVRGFRLRMPWLACNLVGGMICAVIATWFDLVLSQVLLLAMFIPLVLTLAESISVQAVTLGLQQLHMPGFSWTQMRRRLTTEWRTAALLGAANGLLVGAAALCWRYGWHPPLVIAVSILVSMTLAATLGTVIPAVLRLVKLDPRIAAGPIVLMCTDIVTLTFYLTLATWWLL